MAIKAIVEKLEDVPEQYRDLYTERNGKFEVTGIEGMKTEADVTRVTTALEKERGEHKKTKDNFKLVVGDRKPEEVVALLDRIPELEAAAEGKIDDTKLNGLVEARLKTKIAPVERELNQTKAQLAERDGVINEFKGKERTRTIHDSVRDAIGKSQGFQATAIEDVLMVAERMFDVGEDGGVIARDGVGITPGIRPDVWLTEMQAKRPHWWGSSTGGGAGGNSGRTGGAGGTNPFTREGWNMTEQGNVFKADPRKAEQLAKSAGTSIGGGMPALKK